MDAEKSENGMTRVQQKQRMHIVRRMLPKLKKLFPDARIMLRYKNPWELLVAVMLSAQCTDKKVNEVTERLFRKYLTLDDYAHASQSAFERAIFPTGFYRAKAKNILASARIVREQFNGRVPKTMREMLTLPGVGRKTAHVVLGNAYGVVEGIAVDTHVKRLARVFGLTDSEDPNTIEKDLMQIVPRKEWLACTYLLIEYGRRYCTARKHDHEKCPLTPNP